MINLIVEVNGKELKSLPLSCVDASFRALHPLIAEK